ncbi:hypothetical protein DF947_01330 [Pedobacter paludis]|uniref:Uncharacterized protein n=1 Tax=Pedobacter paludis TaxID=2203212 RepID=A0A317F387_9SPHI|nr:hypothetical protein DF947_01330 [Pedobacter paludis]
MDEGQDFAEKNTSARQGRPGKIFFEQTPWGPVFSTGQPNQKFRLKKSKKHLFAIAIAKARAMKKRSRFTCL